MKILFIILGFVMIFYSAASFEKHEIRKPPLATKKNNPADNLIDKEKSLKAFQTILSVLKSPRCINCHPTGDVPRQGDVQRLHPFGVVRGEADHGGKVQNCATCHHTENMEFSNVPGAPHWGLAPKSMGWFGLSDSAIAKRLMDKKSNGNRSPQDLVTHMSSDSLVLWAWNPGKGRSKPPVGLEEWRRVLKEWIDNGAAVAEK
jgi:hypothetical protein